MLARITYMYSVNKFDLGIGSQGISITSANEIQFLNGIVEWIKYLGEFDVLMIILSTSGFGYSVPSIPSYVENAERGWVVWWIDEILIFLFWTYLTKPFLLIYASFVKVILLWGFLFQTTQILFQLLNIHFHCVLTLFSFPIWILSPRNYFVSYVINFVFSHWLLWLFSIPPHPRTFFEIVLIAVFFKLDLEFWELKLMLPSLKKIPAYSISIRNSHPYWIHIPFISPCKRSYLLLPWFY